HAQGAIHRDVKPSNLMVDHAGRVKLLDFGLAHLAENVAADRDTSLGRLLGTLDYMAPEQAGGGEPLDQRADLYGLGATLFFLLTGRPPHGGADERPLLAQLRRIAEQAPPRVAAIRPDVPAELNDLIARLLAPRPEERPGSAEEVAAMLAPLAGGDLARRVAEIAPPDDDPRDTDAAEVAEAEASLAELLGERRDATAPNEKKAESDAVAHSRRLPRWLVLAAIAVAAVCLGVVLVLQTPEGTLRIESEADNIRVELVNEEQEVQSLEIQEGDKETVLRAGRYRVRLAGGHDSLQVTPDAFTLQAGEEVLARIRYEKQPAVANGKPATDEPIYMGEPRSVWQDRFEREKSTKAKITAAGALVELATGEPAEEQAAVWLKVGAELSEQFPQRTLYALAGHRPWEHEERVPLVKRAGQAPWQELAPYLVSRYVEGEGSQAAFAGALLATVSGEDEAVEHPQAAHRGVDRLLEIPESDDRWFESRLLAAAIVPQSPQAVEWLQATADVLLENRDESEWWAFDAWFRQSLAVPVTAALIAEVLGARTIADAHSHSVQVVVLGLGGVRR
ncbi:MAG: serine/threonine protein kinase, partial [Planctomycetes bacterium]|nr:serine/threonine protein kinase [Planctomycetota bacterium]